MITQLFCSQQSWVLEAYLRTTEGNLQRRHRRHGATVIHLLRGEVKMRHSVTVESKYEGKRSSHNYFASEVRNLHSLVRHEPIAIMWVHPYTLPIPLFETGQSVADVHVSVDIESNSPVSQLCKPPVIVNLNCTPGIWEDSVPKSVEECLRSDIINRLTIVQAILWYIWAERFSGHGEGNIRESRAISGAKVSSASRRHLWKSYLAAIYFRAFWREWRSCS